MRLRYAVGDTIRTLRKERGLTLRDVSSSQHIALGYLSEIERGAKEPSSFMLESIAVALELTTAELLKEIYEYLEGN